MSDQDDITGLWDSAVLQYLNATGVDLFSQSTPQVHSVDDLMKLTVDKEDHFKKWRNDGGKISKFRSVVKASLGPLNILGGFAVQGASNVFPPSSTIFTAVSFLINTANNQSADYDKVVAIFEQLRSFLGGLNVLKGHIPSSPEIRRCITDILTSILVLIGLSTKEMKHGRAIGFLKDLKGENDEITSAYNHLQTSLRQEERLLQKQNLVYTMDNLDTVRVIKGDVSNIAGTTEQILSIVAAGAKAEDLPTIHRHLQPPSVKDYEALLKNLIPGTATWILKQPSFINWVDRVKPVLWLSGGPGFGKSHLSTLAIQHVLQKAPQQGPREASVGYYYFHDNDHRKQSVLRALCAIIYQIAERDEIYRMHTALVCQRSPGIEMATIDTVWKDFIVHEFGPKSSGWLYLIFDGIDEAARQDIVEFVSLLQDSLKDGLRAQVLFVGRPEMDIIIQKLSESPMSTIEISSEMNTKDIMRFIEFKYDEYITIRKVKGLREKVIASLREKADGMFLWVDLMYQELEDIKQPKKLKLALENMSTGLMELYGRILTRIETTKGSEKTLTQMREIFCWVAYSKEPLSIFYLNHIIQFVVDDDMFDAERIIRTNCTSLFRLVETGQALFDTLMKSETLVKEGLNPNDGELDETSESGSEIDEDEADVREEERQHEICVHLRHASLLDYIKSKDLKATRILFEMREAKLHIILTSLRIICEGSNVPRRLWLYAMQNWLSQLRDLDERSVSEDATKRIVELIANIFISKPLGKFIAELAPTLPYVYIDRDNFFFGSNTDLQNSNRTAIEKWLKIASSMKSVHLEPEVDKWVNEVLENPLRLLAPLTETCIREWLDCDKPVHELYMRFDFAWHCILSTDLIPPYPIPSEGFHDRNGFLKYPDFAKGDPYIFLADVIQVERSIEIHCHIARTMSYRHFNLVGANREYQKAIEMAQKIGSEEKLKDIYLEYALSLTDVRLRKGDPKALQAVESYIALDKSNYKMYACLGVARLQLQDRKGAIEAFREALSLNNRDNLVVRALVSSLRSAADFEGMIELFDNYDLDTTTFWIRGQLEYESFQEAMFYAARKTDKVELLIKRYKHAMQTTWDHSSGQGEDDKLDPLWDELGEARGCANEHKFYSAGTSLLHCWLAVLCRRYLGQPDAAFDHWKAAFLQRSEIFKLSNVSSMFTDSIFPDMFAQFAELLYDKALGPGGSVDENMLTILERVCQRQDAFRKSAPYVTTLSGPKSIDLLLARLYIRCEMKEEAEALLNEQFRHGIDMLKGTITWSDRDAYRILSRILFISDHINEAKIALSLRRFLRFKHTAIENSNVDKNEDSKADETLAGIEETTYGRRPGFKCASREDCPGKGRVGLGEPMYSCMTCIEVDFCEECYDALMRNERTKGKKLIYVCDYNHEFLSSPLEDWEIKDGVMTISGEKVRVAEWVDIVEKKWNSGHKL